MIFTNNQKPLRIIFFAVIMTVLIGIGFYKLYQDNSCEELVKTYKTDELNDIHIDNDMIESKLITGSDLLRIYSELKEKKFALLVATKAFLVKDNDELINDNEYSYIRYVLSKNDDRIVESIRINDGFVPLSFINYNNVLADKCLYQDTDSIYKVVLGFISDVNNEDPNLISNFPLTSKGNNEIFNIHEDSLFKAKFIHNDDGTLIGYAFLEQ